MRETDSSWTLLVDFLTDAARSETIEEGFDQLLSMAERLVPARWSDTHCTSTRS
jgi:hypothetical protein